MSAALSRAKHRPLHLSGAMSCLALPRDGEAPRRMDTSDSAMMGFSIQWSFYFLDPFKVFIVMGC